MASDNEKQQKRAMRMATDPMRKLIPSMAIPTIIAFLITSIYNMADTYFVSGLGTNATAAVGVNASLDQIIMMAGSLFALGANSYIARLIGAKKPQKASQVLSTAFFTAGGIGVIFLVLGTLFMTPMCRLLGATDTCLEYSIQYATYVLWVAPFMATSFVMNQCLRAEGSALLSMIGLGFGGVLNCFLDPLFIIKLDMGVRGASIATAISKMVSFLILIAPYVMRKSMLHLSIKEYRFDGDIFKQILAVGSSSLFRSGLAVVSAIVLNRIAGGFSDSVLAAIGVCNKIMMFPFSIILGLGSGFTPVAGFNWGANNFKRVRQSFRFTVITALVVGIVMALIFGIPSNFIIGLFTTADADMMALGSLAIRLQCVTLPIHAVVAIVNMYCAGLGKASGALILAIARQGICFFPIVFPMAIIWGANGVASVQAIADGLTIILAIPIYIAVSRMVNKAEKAYIENHAEAVS